MLVKVTENSAETITRTQVILLGPVPHVDTVSTKKKDSIHAPEKTGGRGRVLYIGTRRRMQWRRLNVLWACCNVMRTQWHCLSSHFAIYSRIERKKKKRQWQTTGPQGYGQSCICVCYSAAELKKSAQRKYTIPITWFLIGCRHSYEDTHRTRRRDNDKNLVRNTFFCEYVCEHRGQKGTQCNYKFFFRLCLTQF